MKKYINRRDFLKLSAATAAAGSPLFSLFGAINNSYAATIGSEYKAIVCVLLEGGADSFNMVVPRSGQAYTEYSTIRENMALSNTSLLPLTPANYNDGVEYGFHPKMARMHTLFTNNKLAVVSNVGTLVQPVTKTEIENGASVPNQLFAHNTQRDLWMTSNAAGAERAGWAARLADVFDNSSELFNVTVGGKNLMQTGGAQKAFEFGGGEIYAFDDHYAFRDDGALGDAYLQILGQNSLNNNRLMKSFADSQLQSIRISNELSESFENIATFTGFTNGVHETGTPLGKQLKAVAEMLSIKEDLPGRPRRQIFFVNQHDWDTHAGALNEESHKVEYLDASLGAFADALAQLGLENQVTTCTISDFGRSITPNGAGTDHGWGGHAYVMGGAVQGKDIYGVMPQIKADSPDAIDDRVIPTTSVEQYLATIAKWFGASNDDLDVIFPNLNSFPTRNLGFLA
jgi:uncharacterized protein (DUF1501 family)